MKTRLMSLSLVVLALCACNARPNFQAFSSAKCGISVLMPGEPKEETRSTEASGVKLDFTLYTATVGNSAYIAGCNDFPQDLMATADKNDMLDGAVSGALSEMGATLDSQGAITVDGHPGREVVGSAKIGGQDAVVKARIVLVNNRLIQALVMGEKRQVDAADMSRYLESLKIS